MNVDATDTPHSMILSRGILHRSRRVVSETQPLLRDETSETVDEEFLELPVPGLVDDDAEEVHVLHVDDDPQYTELTKTLLERVDEDIHVVGETTVVAALNQLRAGEFDCIISDYDMPHTNGLEFLEIVREQYPDLPFILFTGKGSEEIASQAIAAGVTDYVQKTGGTEQYEVLANRVRNAVDQYHAQQRFWDALSWYQRLVEQDLTGVFIVQDQEFLYVNRRFSDIFGYSQCELVGESPLLIVSESDEEVFLEMLREFDPNDTFQRSFTGRRVDGSEIGLEVHGGPVQYRGERGFMGVVWDRND